MSFFPSLNEHSFQKKTLNGWATNRAYCPCHKDVGVCHSQRHNHSTFQLCLAKWLSQNYDWMCLGKWLVCRGVKGGLVTPQSLLTIKKDTKISDSCQTIPLQYLYDHSFHWNLICPRSKTYNHFPESCGGIVIF